MVMDPSPSPLDVNECFSGLGFQSLCWTPLGGHTVHFPVYIEDDPRKSGVVSDFPNEGKPHVPVWRGSYGTGWPLFVRGVVVELRIVVVLSCLGKPVYIGRLGVCVLILPTTDDFFLRREEGRDVPGCPLVVKDTLGLQWYIPVLPRPFYFFAFLNQVSGTHSSRNFPVKGF